MISGSGNSFEVIGNDAIIGSGNTIEVTGDNAIVNIGDATFGLGQVRLDRDNMSQREQVSPVPPTDQHRFVPADHDHDLTVMANIVEMMKEDMKLPWSMIVQALDAGNGNPERVIEFALGLMMILSNERVPIALEAKDAYGNIPMNVPQTLPGHGLHGMANQSLQMGAPISITLGANISATPTANVGIAEPASQAAQPMVMIPKKGSRLANALATHPRLTACVFYAAGRPVRFSRA